MRFFDGVARYFDAAASGTFKTAQDGRPLFFPWGTLGRGYVIGTEQDFTRLKRQVKIYLIGSAAVIGILMPWLPLLKGLGLALLLMAPYAIWAWSLTRGLQPSDERLSFGESMTQQALAYGTATLWMLEIASLAFVVSGIVIALVDPDNRLVGMAGIAFFGLCAAVFAFQLAVRSRLAVE